MKKINSIFAILLSFVLMVSCQQEQDFSNENIGYLRLDLGVNTSAISRAETPYDPKQIAVQIIAKDGEVVKETNDWTEWESQQIALPVGMYTLKASSAGFDGKTSGFDKPYYAGSAEINIEKDKEVNETVTCTLANVKVTVNFDQSFIDAFKEAKVTVDDNAENGGIESLDFIMGQENKSAYFPVITLKAVVNVVTKQNVAKSQTKIIENVQARDHYILNYKVGEVTGGDVSVSIDPTTRTYTYNVTISTQPKTTLTVSSTNAWAKFAYLEGTAVTTETLESAKMVMEYRQKNTEEWTSLATTVEEGTYKAKVEGLTPTTQYECRMVYGEEEYVSEIIEFTTEAATVLYNGNFDSWYKSGKTWYAVTESDFNINGSFWDSSNPGTTTGVGALVNKNPTQGNSTVLHTPGGQSAELKSQYASALGIGKFAAASLYSGSFNSLVGTNGAKIDFGQPFVSRPTALHGWFQYTPVAIDYVGGNQPAGTVGKGDMDICSIYIAISKKKYTVDNTNTETFIQFLTDDNIIAYGELPVEDCVSTNGEWKEFNIKLNYKTLERPSDMYIILVASSSKYGDYFTGGNGSVMYLDDFELIYDGEPSLQE